MAIRQYKPVNSSNIAGVDYDPDTQTLYVQFRNGSEYKYDNVPSDEYERLATAPSVGSYFNDYIKQSYSYTRL